MSFTAEVKDELSRVQRTTKEEQTAELAALVRVCGSLSIHGIGRYSLSMSTETGSVARIIIKLIHSVYDLETQLTVRRSVLHKTRNYLIVVPEQPQLVEALIDMGVLNKNYSLQQGVDAALIPDEKGGSAYLRGAFLGGGFIADPRGDFHFELVANNLQLAEDIAELSRRFGVNARVSHRRSAYSIYLKNAEGILTFLVSVGAHASANKIDDVRSIKSLRNDVNRRVNAEIANESKAYTASLKQIEEIKRIETAQGLSSLPAALEAFALLRLQNPDLNLRELGEASDPPLSKSAVYHRVRRISEIAAHLGDTTE